MKFLKRLTKVISAVLASAAVFSFGFSGASALGDGCMVFQTSKVRYGIEFDEKTKAYAIYDAKTSETKYGVCIHKPTGRYCLITVPDGKCLYTIDCPANGDEATSYTVYGSRGNQVCVPTITSVLEGKWGINRGLDLRYVKPSNPGLNDTRCDITDYRGAKVGVIFANKVPRNTVNMVAFLLATAFLK